MLKHFLQFSLVGAGGVIVNLLVFLLLESSGCYYLLAATAAFLAAASNNFYWNYYWTFKNKKLAFQSVIKRYLKFLLISGFCLLGNLYLLDFFVREQAFPPWQAQLLAVALMSVFSFILQNALTFAKEKQVKI